MTHTFSDPDLAELDRIWPLGRQLVVPEHGDIIVVGAYEGRYVSYLHELFPAAFITAYEPQTAKFDVLKARCANNHGLAFNAGLATAIRSVHLGNWGTDGATVATTDDHAYGLKVKMLDAVEELSSHLCIDLLLMNCEGSEWPLIPYLLDEMMHHRIRSMAIQFHPKYVSNERAERVLSYLDEYYVRKYWDYPAWTYWERLSYI